MTALPLPSKSLIFLVFGAILCQTSWSQSGNASHTDASFITRLDNEDYVSGSDSHQTTSSWVEYRRTFFSSTNAFGTIQSYGYADFGVAKAQSLGGSPGPNVYLSTQSSFSDEAQFLDSSQPLGTVQTAHASVILRGEAISTLLGESGAGYTEFGIVVGVSGYYPGFGGVYYLHGNVFGWDSILNLAGNDPAGPNNYVQLSFSFQVTNGSYVGISGSLYTQIGAVALASDTLQTANVDFACNGCGLLWNGITSVDGPGHQSFGSSISLIGQSGFDYALSSSEVAAIPEGPTALLMGAGLLVGSIATRRRKAACVTK